ncbi:MAG: hypothetical protein JXB05_24370 [Myxococcaceae bacterium]|nr:hypothetical protein [Myxococcaceae bacterium]
MQGKIEVIEAEQLRDFLAQGGCVAVGKVQKVEVFNQGTRGAKVRIVLDVEKQLHGALPRQVSFVAWGDPDTAKVGQQLLFAIKPPVPQLPDAVLLSFYTIPEGKAEEVARAQQEVLSKVGQGR